MNKKVFQETISRDLESLCGFCCSPIVYSIATGVLLFFTVAIGLIYKTSPPDAGGAALFLIAAFLYSVVVLMLWLILKAAIEGFYFMGFDSIARSPGYRAFMLPREERYFRKYVANRIPRQKEKIIASANLDVHGNIWAVLRPGRHHHVLWYMAEHGMNKESREQGFLTNRYRFIGRHDARKLAIQNGQCKKPFHSHHLFSEDLWETPARLRQKD